MRLTLLAVFAAATLCQLSAAAEGPASAPAAAAIGPLAAPPADMAQVVFVDPSNAIANAFPPAVYDVTTTPRIFISKLGAHVNVATAVTPGHHLFMIRTIGVTQFLDANVEAGHRYYVLARFIYGHGFQLRPLRSNLPAGASEFSVTNPKFKDWLTDAQWPAHTDEYPEGTDPARFAAKLDEVQAAGLTEWNAKSAEQKAELTLGPADAYDH